MARKLAVVPELEAELDRLYGLPLEEFTAARNELAARLKRAGQAEQAAEVRTLRKPSLPVWVVNQLARRQADDVSALVAAGEELRKSQEAALRGASGETVREAAARERTALRNLTRCAQQLLEAEGRPATHETLERIAATLRAAVVDPDAARQLVAGRLADEIDATGFGAVTSLAPSRPPQRRRESATAREAARERRLERVRELRSEAKQLAQDAKALERDASEADRAARRAHERAERARAAADSAAARLAAAQRDEDEEDGSV